DVVVERKIETDRRARRERHALSRRHVAADLGIDANVLRLPAEARDLEIVEKVDALSRVDAVVPKIERRAQLDVRDEKRRERRVERAFVREGPLVLERVRERRGED